MPCFTITKEGEAELREHAREIAAWDEELERREKSLATAKVRVDMAKLDYLSAMSVLAQVCSGRKQAIERRNEKLRRLREGKNDPAVDSTDVSGSEATPPDGEGSDTD